MKIKLQLKHWSELEDYLYDKHAPKQIMNIYYAIRDDAVKGRKMMRNTVGAVKKGTRTFKKFVDDVEGPYTGPRY